MKLPGKTVQRLSKYRRILHKYRYLEEPYIFSHDLARLLNIKPVQVRRDLMLIGGSGNHRKGYHVKELIQLIGEKIDSEKGRSIILVGIGKLGQAIAEYLSEREMFQQITAVFDIDPVKVGKSMYDIPCYDIRELHAFIKKNKVNVNYQPPIPSCGRGSSKNFEIKIFGFPGPPTTNYQLPIPSRLRRSEDP